MARRFARTKTKIHQKAQDRRKLQEVTEKSFQSGQGLQALGIATQRMATTIKNAGISAQELHAGMERIRRGLPRHVQSPDASNIIHVDDRTGIIRNGEYAGMHFDANGWGPNRHLITDGTRTFEVDGSLNRYRFIGNNGQHSYPITPDTDRNYIYPDNPIQTDAERTAVVPEEPYGGLDPAQEGADKTAISNFFVDVKETTIAQIIEALTEKVIITADIYKRIVHLVDDVSEGNTVEKVVGIILSEHNEVKESFSTKSKRKIRLPNIK